MKISACIPTRGDVPMDAIFESLPYDDICVWDNAKLVDMGVFARFCAAADFARHDTIYFQDDDVVFRAHDTLLMEWERRQDKLLAVDAHGDNYAGLEDVALVGAGALVTKRIIDDTWRRWFDHYQGPPDDGLLLECDFVFGVLAPHMQIRLPYERLYADDGMRPHLCREPWQEDLKRKYVALAREVRDSG